MNARKTWSMRKVWIEKMGMYSVQVWSALRGAWAHLRWEL